MKKKKTMEKTKQQVPDHVSWAVQDAWLSIPPCTYSENPYCHMDCPYHYECYPDFYEGESDEWG